MGEGLDAYKVLYSESVVYTRGRRIDNMIKDMPKVIEYNPKYLFLSYGANDIIKWNGDVEGFINAYKNSISYIKEVLPDTTIIINSVLPVSEKAINNKSAFTYQSEFNSKLMELCKSMEIDFLENSRFLLEKEEPYGYDGIHPKRFFFYLWGRQMASYLNSKSL